MQEILHHRIVFVHQTAECRHVGRPRVWIHTVGGAPQMWVLVGVGLQLVLCLQVHSDVVDLGAAEWTLEPRSFLLGLQRQHTDSYDTVNYTDRQTDIQTDVADVFQAVEQAWTVGLAVEDVLSDATNITHCPPSNLLGRHLRPWSERSA